MNTQEPQFDPKEWEENMRSIFARMVRLKWIDDPNPMNSIPWWKNLTQLGLAKIGKVSDALIRTAPGAFKAEDLSGLTAASIKQPTSAELTKMLIEIAPIVFELKPPEFSKAEEEVLIGMFYHHAREHGKNLIPPAPGYRPPAV